VTIPIDIKVNGEQYRVKIEPQTTLLELLRDSLRLTGTKEGCGLGECGACVVLVQGRPVNSCLMLAADANGCDVVTIEGLTTNGALHPLQQSFVDEGAIQCGFCTPAMVLSAKALLDGNPEPVEEEIKEALSGVLCRCGSYNKIIRAVQSAAERTRQSV
jgi:carbon-monoxide dehydrogenase small subunit